MDTLQQMQAKIAAMESQLLDAAIVDATSSLEFVNTGCRDFTRDQLRMQAKRAADGSYSANNLPLADFLKNADWLPGMLQPVPAGAPEATVSDGTPARRTEGFDLSAIRPGMSTADKDQARAAINSELAKMSNPGFGNWR
jgi:hypothetical protein